MTAPTAGPSVAAPTGALGSSAGSPVARLSGVTKTYPGAVAVRALDGVDLSIDAGELLALVGASGSGKSTLLAVLGGLDRADEGVVSIVGHDLSRLSDGQRSAARARLIGFVFQQFHLLPTLSALENVALGLLYEATPRRERLRRSEEALVRVGLAERLRHRPAQLSGGEQQRVAVARALVGSPALLLADEPTGALDSAAGENVMRLLRDVAAEGTAVVVVTHDREIARALPRRVRLSDGRVVSDERSGR